MTTISSQTEETLRQLFKRGNKFMLLMWRLGLGKWLNAWPKYGGRIMVITHTGRKTGLKRYTPVNYALVDGEIYCTAGFGAISDWYRNITANPQVEIWLPDGWWAGVAEEITDTSRRIPLMREVLIGSGFAARLFGINPRTLSDEALGQITSTYRLIHIRRTGERTGTGGPGDLDWVWPLATLFLLFGIMSRQKRTKYRGDIWRRRGLVTTPFGKRRF